MTAAAPTILALQSDSAWVVILAVSFVTLPVVLLLRRLVNRAGGVASGLLLSLPLALPLVVALIYGHPVLPEIAVLRPAISVLTEGSRGAAQPLLLLRDSSGRVVIPYALVASTGPWLLLGAAAASSFMLLRRLLGAIAVRRLISRCVSVTEAGHPAVATATSDIAFACGLRECPEVLVLPGGMTGAFATGGRPGRILLGADLLERLDERELEATIAHELAHLKACDTRVLATAGFLRDLSAWNPLAHIAYRRLALDRELEADRRAAAITGRPLAVASSLLKMCELIHERRSFRLGGALGMWSRRGRLNRRVSTLLAMADGSTVAGPTSYLPFLAAAVLSVVLALQVGVMLTSDQHPALAFVWGAPDSAEAEVWKPRNDIWDIKRRTSIDRDATQRANNSGKTAAGQPLPPRGALAALQSAPAVAPKNLGRWVSAVTALARRGGWQSSGLETRRGWQVRPLFAAPGIGSLSVYRVEPLAIPDRALVP